MLAINLDKLQCRYLDFEIMDISALFRKGKPHLPLKDCQVLPLT